MDGGPRRRARSHGRVTCTAAPSGPSPERPRSGYDTEIREQLPRSGLVQLGELFQPAAPGPEPATREINSLASGQCRSKWLFGTDVMPSGPRHVASRCPGRAPPPAGLRGPSRRLGGLPLALVPAALAFGGLLPELLEEGAPRVDVDHGDASGLVIASLSVPLG